MTENDDLFAKMDKRFDKVENDLVLIKWMMGFILAFQVAILAKLFMH